MNPVEEAPSWDEIIRAAWNRPDVVIRLEDIGLTQSTYEDLVEKAACMDAIESFATWTYPPTEENPEWRIVGDSSVVHSAPTRLEAIRKARGDES